MFSPKPSVSSITVARFLFRRFLLRGAVVLAVWVALSNCVPAYAFTGGTVSGLVTDPSGAFVKGAVVTLISSAQQNTYRTISNRDGSYTFPNVAVGNYELSVSAGGFSTLNFPNIAVDTGAALRIDAHLTVASASASMTVNSGADTHVETMDTELGQTVSGAQMEALPLNGRSFTDLLAIQPGVVPVSTLLPSSVIMAGVTGSIDPSGDANPGNLSINGQRESSNGFTVNGIDVQEHMNGGTSIIPNLDSIDQFRVLTNNFDPEYGNYNGGMVAVVSKPGTNQLRGNAFEFFRNTALDARGYFDPTRSAFNQNQFGGTIGGPVVRTDIFFFADYQGTRTTQGVSTGNISVPTVSERNGLFDRGELTGSVSGSYLAQMLSQELGYTVMAGEPYTNVFPGGQIPKVAWSAPATHLLGYVPSPNVGTGQFSTSANSETVRDDKGSARIDANSRWGMMSAYYFADDYSLDNPYPGSVAGASVPGFDALYIGRAQLFSLGNTKIVGANSVNELHIGYVRNANVIGQPHGGLGVSLASQGFSTGSSGIYVQAPQFEGVENITFPTFVMGVPITNLTQVNNTLYLSDGFSRAIASHTLKFGAQFHADQVNEHPNATFNGTFNIDGTETGSAYADFLLGVASNFTQSSGQPFYLRNRYLGFYLQDSWRASHSLTVNAGLRWDIIAPWSEKYNQLQTWIAGAQSTLYPGAPLGLVVAGDPGIPSTIAPVDHGSFAPRLGVAYAPRPERRLGKAIFGGFGRTSIRASYGLFYTAFQGLSAGIMYAVPPFGYNYLSPAPPLLATPFITAATGYNNGQRFPFAFPPHSTSASHPDTAIDWTNFTPLSADPFFDHADRPAYLSSYMFSVERQLSQDFLLTLSYVGNQGHRELALRSANPGNPALCLALASAGCGPFGEDSTYTTTSGQVVNGTRVGQNMGRLVGSGENYGENTSDSSIANSNYNGLDATLRYTHGGSQVLLSYTYAKSIDQGSNLGEQLNPIDARASRTISAWDIRHDLVASYTLSLPFALIHPGPASLVKGWSVSGATRLASGLPVNLFDNSDNSLLGTLGNGANNYLLDTPQFAHGALRINTNGRNGRPAFNTSLFQEEALGQLGNAKRRIFYGPGIENFDLTLRKTLQLPDEKLLEFRVEAFNAFNHAQFYGPAAVDGQIEDPNFGSITAAAAPRLMQLAAKFSF
jgi:hypothetical protein